MTCQLKNSLVQDKAHATIRIECDYNVSYTHRQIKPDKTISRTFIYYLFHEN